MLFAAYHSKLLTSINIFNPLYQIRIRSTRLVLLTIFAQRRPRDREITETLLRAQDCFLLFYCCSVDTFQFSEIPRIVAHQALLSMGFRLFCPQNCYQDSNPNNWASEFFLYGEYLVFLLHLCVSFSKRFLISRNYKFMAIKIVRNFMTLDSNSFL